MLTPWRNDSLKDKAQWIKINGDQAARVEQQFEGAPLLSHRNSLLSFYQPSTEQTKSLCQSQVCHSQFLTTIDRLFRSSLSGSGVRSAVDSRTGCGAGELPQCVIPSGIWRLYKEMERDRICHITGQVSAREYANPRHGDR